MIRSAATDFSTVASSEAKTSSAELRYGSLLSIGAVNGCGYHALPVACGAR
jgi:hypothetical protein